MPLTNRSSGRAKSRAPLNSNVGQHQKENDLSSRDDSGALILILLPIGAFLLFVLWLSRSIGADFQTTLEAVFQTAVCLALAGAIIWFADLKLSLIASGFSVFSWPFWWKVLDSIANGGKNQTEFFLPQEVWYTTAWFKYGIEVALIGLLIFVISKGIQRY